VIRSILAAPGAAAIAAVAAIAVTATGAGLTLHAQDMGRRADIVDLAIGDPARKDRKVTVGVDRLIDTSTAAEISPADLARRFRDTRLLLIGETHTSSESHRVQRQVIEALHHAGRRVIIGLEMYPYTAQVPLDRWSRGAADGPAPMSEEAFIKESAWYLHWGYHFGYYRDIFLFARDRGVRMVGVNAPREVISAVRKKGLRNLAPEEARQLPPEIDTDDPEHLALFKAHFGADDVTHGGSRSGSGSGGITDDVWKNMLAAQTAWDATMAFHAVKAWREARDDQAIVVVLVGSGHVAYGLGIERQARRWFDREISTLLPIDIKQGETLDVRASYANVVWGVPSEPYPAHPSLGITPVTRSADQLQQVVSVDRNSAAARAGVVQGDIVLAIDGQPVASREDFNRLSALKDWGDTAEMKIRRGAEELTLKLLLRR
jgi:uncharacterized iron-regulated protein